tara:strand:- start:4915 stop:5337 length:423 start_codon:yes stop_codon:yes gene_type:complete
MVKAIIILSLLLIISVILNGFLIWYIRNTLSKLFFISENLSFLKLATRAYVKHLKGIYQLETYYGDENIKFLFEHTGDLIKKIEEFDDIIEVSEDQEIILDDREIEIGNEAPQETSETLEGSNEEHVLYGGTRAGNNNLQ